MLVLSRKKSEWIVVGDDLLRIAVVEIRGDKVRLGFEAPTELAVHRQEVFDSIQRNRNGKAETRTAERLPGRGLMDQLAMERRRRRSDKDDG